MPSTLAARHLRWLTVEPRMHPRGQQHLSAASGLVCAHGRAYVIADDEHHLAVFRDRDGPGSLHRILAGDLPQPKQARKRLKADLETLLLLPALRPSATETLVALGSGSRPNRNMGVVIPLDAEGEPSKSVHRFDLQPLYQPLRAALGEINIEGAMVIGDELVLLHRGGAGGAGNAAAHLPLRCLLDAIDGIDGTRSSVQPASLRRYSLGDIDGVKLGFTDGAALPDGGWVFTAVAEDSSDSYADGPCNGSAVGRVSASGDLLSMRRLEPPAKVEGIDVRLDDAGMMLCMVTDADDPALSSRMLMARL